MNFFTFLATAISPILPEPANTASQLPIEAKTSFKPYTKAGVEVVFSLPTVGAGFRFHEENWGGLDTSINYMRGTANWGYFGTSKVSILSWKALGLAYPWNNKFYLGAGIGAGTEIPFSKGEFFVSFEQSIGYEFLPFGRSIAPFVQLELTESSAPGLLPISPCITGGIAF